VEIFAHRSAAHTSFSNLRSRTAPLPLARSPAPAPSCFFTSRSLSARHSIFRPTLLRIGLKYIYEYTLKIKMFSEDGALGLVELEEVLLSSTDGFVEWR